jgi:hypothetical protein
VDVAVRSGMCETVRAGAEVMPSVKDVGAGGAREVNWAASFIDVCQNEFPSDGQVTDRVVDWSSNHDFNINDPIDWAAVDLG